MMRQFWGLAPRPKEGKRKEISEEILKEGEGGTFHPYFFWWGGGESLRAYYACSPLLCNHGKAGCSPLPTLSTIPALGVITLLLGNHAKRTNSK